LQEVLSYDELSKKVHAAHGRVFFVSGKTFELSDIESKLQLAQNPNYTRFANFEENPNLEDLVNALDMFRKSKASIIIALGGGTAIDLAKLIKYYSETDIDRYAMEPIISSPLYSSIEMVAIPSTFGTGSESTHFAVLYIQGKKFSIADDIMLPDSYLLDSTLSYTLPGKVKGSACLDALCQAIESYWSVSATLDSRKLAREAISLIVDNYDLYLKGDVSASANIAIAANLSGKAINKTKTTAAHALSYALTSFYGIAHGHAVALCIKNMFNVNMDKARDEGNQECCSSMLDIYSLLKVCDGTEASKLIGKYMEVSGLLSRLSDCKKLSPADVKKIVTSVNLERLNNHPVSLTTSDMVKLFD